MVMKYTGINIHIEINILVMVQIVKIIRKPLQISYGVVLALVTTHR